MYDQISVTIFYISYFCQTGECSSIMPVTVIKYPDKSNLGMLIWVTILGDNQ